MEYKAHIDENSGEIQTVKEHSENTALLCRQFSFPDFKDMMYVTGLLLMIYIKLHRYLTKFVIFIQMIKSKKYVYICKEH